ncbi:SHOCT domain-containing protein [Haladaptatus sp. NG-SE-30]
MATTDDGDSLLRIFLVVLAVLLLVPLLLLAFVAPLMGVMGGSMVGPGFRGQVPLLGWLMMLVPLLVVVGFSYLAYRMLAGGGGNGGIGGGDRALEELRMAYARGDISEEEFEKRRERLQREE